MIAAVLIRHAPDEGLRVPQELLVGGRVSATLLDEILIALELDRAMRERAPAGWWGDDTHEKQVLNALFPIMSRDRDTTRAIFEIIKQQPGYS
jgi:phage gp46-like protein